MNLKKSFLIIAISGLPLSSAWCKSNNNSVKQYCPCESALNSKDSKALTQCYQNLIYLSTVSPFEYWVMVEETSRLILNESSRSIMEGDSIWAHELLRLFVDSSQTEDIAAYYRPMLKMCQRSASGVFIAITNKNYVVFKDWLGAMLDVHLLEESQNFWKCMKLNPAIQSGNVRMQELDTLMYTKTSAAAYLLYEKGRFAEAYKYSQQARFFKPVDHSITLLHVRICNELGQYTEAIEYAEKALKTNVGEPRNTWYAFEIARAYQGMRDNANACIYYKRVQQEPFAKIAEFQMKNLGCE